MESKPISKATRRQRRGRATASTTSSSRRSWRSLGPLRLRRRIRSNSTAASDSHNGDLPSLVFVDHCSTTSTSFPSSTTANHPWPVTKSTMLLQPPGVETTEVTLETERSMDDHHHHGWVDTTKASLPTTSSRPVVLSMKLLRTMSSRTMEGGRVWIRDNAFEVSTFPLYIAAAIGSMIPFPWILHSFLLWLFVSISKIFAQWMSFYWNDREMILFRRNAVLLLRRFKNELELTCQGNYARQVMASYVFWITTAPGDSIFYAILRYKMNIVNMRVIQELQTSRDRFQSAREKFYGYRRSPRVPQPFT